MREYRPSIGHAPSGRGLIVLMGSTAGRVAYEGGGRYAAAKHGVAAIAGTRRLELSGEPVRVTEIAPGIVRTEEFALNRFAFDDTKAAAVSAGVADPLVAEDVAGTIAWVATLPPHVNIDLMVIRPLGQAAPGTRCIARRLTLGWQPHSAPRTMDARGKLDARGRRRPCMPLLSTSPCSATPRRWRRR